jgi:hypothetical protein
MIGVLGLSLLAARAQADELPRIAVVHAASAADGVTGRLRDELSTLGLSVVDVTLGPEEGATSLDDAARRVDAFAAVQVVPAKGGVEVWIADRVTGKTLLRELVVAPGAALDDVVALQAVELLRASLAELGFSKKPAGDVRSTPAVTRSAPSLPPPRRETRKFWLQVGPALAISPGGLSASGHALIGFRWRAAKQVGADAWGLLPVLSASVSGPEGTADVSPLLFGADVAIWFLEPEADFQVSGAGGVALARLGIDGHAVPPLASRAETSIAPVPFARVSLERRLGSRLGLELDGFVGVAAPRPVLRFNGREVADWGRPLVIGTICFDAAFD